jgi:hypothetical protein
MRDEHLMVEERDELAKALLEDAAALTDESKKENFLKLAQGYRNLANMKRKVSRKVN